MNLKIGNLIEIPKQEALITYKKLDIDLKSPIWRYQYEINKIHRNKDFDLNPFAKKTKRFYSVLSNKLKNIHYPYGIRIFQVLVWGKCIVEDPYFVGSEYLYLKRELPIKEVIPLMDSQDAYIYCRVIKDSEEIRDKITEDEWIYNYLTLVRDNENVFKKMKDRKWIERYLTFKEKRNG